MTGASAKRIAMAIPRARRLPAAAPFSGSAFVLTHLWLGFQNLTESGIPLGDVVIQYRYWAEQADFANYFVGIDKVWVYPIVALVPIIIVAVFGFANYAATWLGTGVRARLRRVRGDGGLARRLGRRPAARLVVDRVSAAARADRARAHRLDLGAHRDRRECCCSRHAPAHRGRSC